MNLTFRFLVAGLAASTTSLDCIAATANPTELLGFSLGAEKSAVVSSLEERGLLIRRFDHGDGCAGGNHVLVRGDKSFRLDGLRTSILIFNDQDKLAGGVLTLSRDRFEAVSQHLKKQFTVTSFSEDPDTGHSVTALVAPDGAVVTVEDTFNGGDTEMTIIYQDLALAKKCPPDEE